MINYANGFSIAADSNRETLIVNLLQHSPAVDSDGNITDGTKTETIDSFVVDQKLALKFANAIINIMNDSDET